MIHFQRLRGPDRDRFAEILIELAEEIRSDHAEHIQRAMAAAAARGYPRRASTAPVQPGNKTDDDGFAVAPDTPVEAAALEPDRTALAALAELEMLDRLLATAPRARIILKAWRPDRPVAQCQACGHPLDRGSTRCRRVDADGRQCGGSDRPEHCQNTNCGTKLEVGKIRDGRCPACARHWSRYTTERIPSSALGLGGNVITDQPPEEP